MTHTPISLLDRLKAAPRDSADWERLHEIYAPLIRHWLGQIPEARAECDELTQRVLIVLLREVPNFERRGQGAFSAWLRAITTNQVRAHLKSRQRQPVLASAGGVEPMLTQLADPASELSRRWDEEHDRHVLHNLLELIRGDFAATTFAAFRRFALEEVPAAQVAAELGMTVNAVLLAKSRILKRLRQEAGEFLD